jgi:O-antigen/teichoic acid export membrane protein
MAVPRRLLAGGSAGDAAVAGGRHIVSNIVVQLFVRVITYCVSIVTVSLTVRTLAPDAYGVWAAVSSYLGLFGVITEVGMTNAAMQRMAAEPERESEWLGALVSARMALSVIVTVACVVSIPLVLTSAHDTHTVAYILSVTILFAGPGALMTVFQSRLRAGLALSFSVLQALIWLGIVISLWASHASVITFAIAYTLLGGVIAVLQVGITRRLAHIQWRAGRRLWRPLLRVAIPLGVSSVLITLYFNVDSVMLLQIAGPREAGIYGAAYGFLGALTFLPAAVMSSFFPVLSARHRRDPARTRRLVQVAADSMGLITLPILAGAIALSDKIVRLLYGPGYERSGGVLPILMLALVSIGFGSLAGYMAPILNLQWRLALYSAAGAVATVALNLVLIPPYGAFGSAWVTVITEVLTMTLMLGTSLKRLHMRLTPWRLLRTLALAAAMTGLMVILRPLGLIPAGVIGVLFYAGGALVFRIVDPRELLALRAQRA